MSKFISESLRSLAAYVPGEQPRDKSYIKLNTNENPFYPSARAMEKITKSQLEDLRLYSDNEATEFVGAVATFYGVENKNIIAGNGSDEILAFCFKAFCDEKKEICFPDITYGFYSVYAALFGLKLNEIPLDDAFNVNVNDYVNVGKNIIIANPNAPTGLALSRAQIEKIVATNPDNVVIIDEAYVDFGAETVVPLIKKYKNLIVVQTCSKSRSLAGARIGFAIADEELINDLKKIKYSFNPYNVNRLSIILGANAVNDKDYFSARCAELINIRENTKKMLKSIGMDYLDSKANFIFAKAKNVSGKIMYEELKKRGILVRYFDKQRLKDYIRISIGRDFEMEMLVEQIKTIKEKVL